MNLIRRRRQTTFQFFLNIRFVLIFMLSFDYMLGFVEGGMWVNSFKYTYVYVCIGDYMYTTVRVAEKTRCRLEALKEHKRESFDEVLNRLMDVGPHVKDELVAELVKDSDEYSKKPFKRAFHSINELRKEIEG